MSDFIFSNNTPGTATNLGTLGFQGNSFPGRTTSRIFDFDSVGALLDPSFTDDIIDHFIFTPYLLSSVRVNFNADTTGDFVNIVQFVPLTGVSAIAGAIVGTWYGGEHADDPPTEDKFTIQAFAAGQINNLATVLPPGVAASGVLWEEDNFAGAEAVWTLTGGPVIVAVVGLEGSGTEQEINENGDVPVEVDYRFTIRPELGLPDPGSSLSFNYDNSFSESQTVIGETGLDTFITYGPRDDFTVTVADNGNILLEDELFPDAPDTLIGIERVEFDDGSLAYDFEGKAGQAYRLYQAAFDRVPDAEGLGFWIFHYDAGNVTLLEMAGFFMQSEEFELRYGDPLTLSDNAFLTLLYNNVLDRNPDQRGFDFWSDQQDAGLTRPEMLQFFSESNENNANVAAAISDGIWYI